MIFSVTEGLAMPFISVPRLGQPGVLVAVQTITGTPTFKLRSCASRLAGETSTRNDISAQHIEGGVYNLTLPVVPAGKYIIEGYQGTMLLEELTIHVYDIDVQGYFENEGWGKFTKDDKGALIHTNFEVTQVNALIVSFEGLPDFIKVVAQGHSQNFGWLAEVGNGEIIGKELSERRLEAFKIKLVDTRTNTILTNRIEYSACTDPNNPGQTYTGGADGSQCGYTGLALALYEPTIILN